MDLTTHSGVKRTYEAGIHHNVGPVEDPNVSKYLVIEGRVQ